MIRDAPWNRDGPDRRRASRAQAEQLDFLNAMILLLAGIIFFFGFSAIVLGMGASSSEDVSQTAANANDRLVEDLLVADPADAYLDQDCASDYFGMAENVSCGITGFNVSAPTESHWLRHSLGIESRHRVNVTILERGGIVTGPSGQDYALGPSVPPNRDVEVSTRYVTFSASVYYLVQVRVW